MRGAERDKDSLASVAVLFFHSIAPLPLSLTLLKLNSVNIGRSDSPARNIGRLWKERKIDGGDL